MERAPLSGLPDELCLRVLGYLSASDLLALALVSLELRRLSSDESLWQELCACNYLPAPPLEEMLTLKQWFRRLARSCVVVSDRTRGKMELCVPHRASRCLSRIGL